VTIFTDLYLTCHQPANSTQHSVFSMHCFRRDYLWISGTGLMVYSCWMSLLSHNSSVGALQEN